MKILITGAQGLLGQDLVEALSPYHALVGTGRRQSCGLSIPYIPGDLRDAAFILSLLAQEKPDVILHTAALTHVDYCEQHPDEAYESNTLVTQNLTEAAAAYGSFVVFFSTDYVFEGSSKEDYREDAVCNPLNVYGKTKEAAEKTLFKNGKTAFVIFRISWLYGRRGKSFPKTILQKAAGSSFLSVVNDQRGRPTSTSDLAAAFKELFDRDKKSLMMLDRSIFHLANEGSATWHEFAVFILKEAGINVPVRAIASSELALPATRPENSVLSLVKAEQVLNLKLRDWKAAVKEFIADYQYELKGLYATQGVGS